MIKDKNKLTLFEIKTSSNPLLNIRLAIGQLFEYAFLDPDANIGKLIVVGPAELDHNSYTYFKLLQSIINKPLEYWSYSFEETVLTNKFKIYK